MADLELQDADLRASDLKLLDTGNLADAKITCGTRTFKIHKSVVCTRSVWFEKALAGAFEASDDLQWRQPKSTTHARWVWANNDLVPV